MTNEDRIMRLEQELTELKSNLREYAKIHQHDIGESQAFRAAIIALIASHPNPDMLAVQMQQHLAQVEADVVARANTEERLQGLQAAQSYLLEVCSIAQRAHHTPE
jgi:hypothetical protein